MNEHCRKSVRATGPICGALAAIVLSACSGGSGDSPPSPAPSSPDGTPAPASSQPAPSSPAPARVDPLTGGRPSTNEVFAVKIDDTRSGRPQVGVALADVVYVEQVEGGLTRLAAVFHSRLPKVVGPVRSVRSSDPELLGQYGPIAFVASGGAHDALPALDRSTLKADINDRGGPGFYRDYSRPAPYNLMVHLTSVPKGSAAKSIGWTWSRSTGQLRGTPKAASVRTWVGGTPVRFDWDAKAKRYVRVINGVRQKAVTGRLIATPNVIVQFCQGHVNYKDVDVAGNPNYYTESVGHGKVAVFRDGHRIDGTWSRPKRSSGTTLTAKDGRPIALAPGGAWVVLVQADARLNR